MPDTRDPLTLLTDGIASALESSTVVKQAMGLAIKNIRAFNKLRGAEFPDVTSETDVPEISVENLGGPTNINLASNLASMDITFSIIINSGDNRVTQFLNPVLWAVWACLAGGLVTGPLLNLTWRDRTFVKKYEFTNVTTGKSNPEFNRGIKGWVAVCSVTFHLIFNKSDIDAFISGS